MEGESMEDSEDVPPDSVLQGSDVTRALLSYVREKERSSFSGPGHGSDLPSSIFWGTVLGQTPSSNEQVISNAMCVEEEAASHANSEYENAKHASFKFDLKIFFLAFA